MSGGLILRGCAIFLCAFPLAGCSARATGSDLGCMLTGHELGSVIEKVDEGSTLTLIAGQIADVAAEGKCKTMVATLIGHPERRVTFTLKDVAIHTRGRSPASRSFPRGGTRSRTPSSSASWPA